MPGCGVHCLKFAFLQHRLSVFQSISLIQLGLTPLQTSKSFRTLLGSRIEQAARLDLVLCDCILGCEATSEASAQHSSFSFLHFEPCKLKHWLFV